MAVRVRIHSDMDEDFDKYISFKRDTAVYLCKYMCMYMHVYVYINIYTYIHTCKCKEINRNI